MVCAGTFNCNGSGCIYSRISYWTGILQLLWKTKEERRRLDSEEKWGKRQTFRKNPDVTGYKLSCFGYLLNNIELYQSYFKKENLDFTRFFDLGFFIVQQQHETIFNNILQFLNANYEKIKHQFNTTFIPQNFFFDCEYNKLPYTYNMIDMNTI